MSSDGKSWDELLSLLIENKVAPERAERILEKLSSMGTLEYLAKGTSFVVLLLTLPDGQKRVVKIEKDDISASGAASKEARFLEIANKYGVGPRLYHYDPDERVLITEYFEGPFIIDFILEERDAEKIRNVVLRALKKAFVLDEAGISHKELASPKRHIIVTREGPRIIDFEKCSRSRKPRNLSQLVQFFFLNPRSSIRDKVLWAFGLREEDLRELPNLIREYKVSENRSELFKRILQRILANTGFCKNGDMVLFSQ